MRSPRPGRRPSRAVPAVLLLVGFALVTVDARADAGSPLDPVRAVVGDVVGPVETAATAALRPFAVVPRHFRTQASLRADVTELQAENTRLRNELVGATVEGNRAAELEGLLAGARRTGYALVPSRVVAFGPAQSFSRTVTIDAGTSAGVHADMTVLNDDGLVGRVLRSSRATSTVLLVVDQESVVGGRMGGNMKVGFLRGRGEVGGSARLDLELVDVSADVGEGDAVVTWGSHNGTPYVAGIPIGRVESTYSTPRQQSTTAVVSPFVDMTSLDLVGVVVPRGTKSDRPVISAGTRTDRGARR